MAVLPHKAEHYNSPYTVELSDGPKPLTDAVLRRLMYYFANRFDGGGRWKAFLMEHPGYQWLWNRASEDKHQPWSEYRRRFPWAGK